ncbi:DUF1264 domain-containing protein [Ascodesmis nigricans]|uniref:DUF1264 domain-containing protein n=1 Tax=Ascodesmis nigricans TaxID=341454 RepID=A0A4S2N6E4_9PEZI|nr:DUF1264 domain-containing protein [Ascodesmis nigricans]
MASKGCPIDPSNTCCTSGGPCKAVPPCSGKNVDDAKSQDFAPTTGICEHLNAFHVYADDEKRFIETNHYCTHLEPDFRQCILYDGPQKGARLLGVEYMCTPELFATFPEEEKQYWHSHVYEVKSGMLVLPKPPFITQEEWDKAETSAMESVVKLYGKTYHFWQVDKGHKYPFGPPSLMMSFTHDGQFDFDKNVGDRDKRFGIDYHKKRQLRDSIPDFKIDPAVDKFRKK